MDPTKNKSYRNPRENANLLSLMFFTYTLPLFIKGYHSAELGIDDIYNPLPRDRSKYLGDRLEKKWANHLKQCEVTKRNPSLLKVLLNTFWPEYVHLGLLIFFMDIVVALSLPPTLGGLLDYFQENSSTINTGALCYASGVVVLNALITLMINQYVMGTFHYGMRVRAACCALIYRKALKMSKAALGETSTGRIVNLLTNDVSRFDYVSIYINYMWASPLTCVLIIYFLYINAGWAGILGTIPIFLVTNLQGYTGKLTAIYRKQTAQKTDERVKLMDEIISGVQVIKMYAWENLFTEIVKLARKRELDIIIKSSYLRGLFMTLNLFTSRAALFCTLLTMALTNQSITASKVFVLTNYFNILSQSMSYMFVRGISEIAELIVGVKRLEEFLLNEEFMLSIKKPYIDEILQKDERIKLIDVTATWNISSSNDAVKNVSISVKDGELLALVGPVGSGKSSILQTILGELTMKSGNKIVNGSLSYASQEAWVFSSSLRQNILFGSEYNETRYRQVVRVCSLEKDFQQFIDGDSTVVDDRGASLSGGQRARINLARAIYRDVDIYLLDDPMSAVDIHVGKHLYNECINGFLKNKTRILVTHQCYHLKNVDNIGIFCNGTIVKQGTFNILTSSNNAYSKLLSDTIPEEIVEEEKFTEKEESSFKKKLNPTNNFIKYMPKHPLQDEWNEKIDAGDTEDASSKQKMDHFLLFKYLRVGSNYLLAYLVLSLYILTQTMASGIDYFVSYWVKKEENNSSSSEFFSIGVVIESWPRETFVYIYGGVVLMLFLVALWRSVVFYKLAIICSQKIHDKMFSKVMSTTMRFFHTNASGRILNRFSKDLGAVDEALPKTILDAFQIILSLMGSMTLVSIVNPYFLVMVALIASIFMVVRHVFLKSSKNIKRLEGILRGSAFTHLAASVDGITTIRALNAMDILSNEFDKHQDNHTGACFMYIVASSAFAFCVDLSCFIFVGVVTFSLLIYGQNLGLEASEVGLAITQAIALTTTVHWSSRQCAEITNNLVSFERVLQYDLLKNELQSTKPLVPPPEWPSIGKIVFRHLTLKYDENLSPVLKDLNIVIHPKEKVGVVGRTGAGKSSIISAIFRLAYLEGDIEIDGIRTEDILLQTLRSRISIIPQEPVLFSGTLRYNLDPFEEYEDNVLYEGLKEVELKDSANIIYRLDAEVMDGGCNFSVGQRQLICLARAVVRRNKILLLDEATANVDPLTDALIQKTIRNKFTDSTVLTVAHRLETIMDSDRVLVMESGTIVDFDHPFILLQNPEGLFYQMVMKAEISLSEKLKKIAENSYEHKCDTYEKIHIEAR